MTNDQLLMLVAGITIGYLVGFAAVTLSFAFYQGVPALPIFPAELSPVQHMALTGVVAVSTASLLGLLAVGEALEGGPA